MLSDNDTYDRLHAAARDLEEEIPRAANTRQRTALEAAVKALDLLALGLLKASENAESGG